MHLQKLKINPGPESVLFVPHTHKSTLKKLVQAEEDRLNNNLATRVKVVERAGNKLKDTLCNKTWWRSEHCGNRECIPCCYSPGSCRRRNVIYRAVCVTCALQCKSSVYLGESSRAWVDRQDEHQKTL